VARSYGSMELTSENFSSKITISAFVLFNLNGRENMSILCEDTATHNSRNKQRNKENSNVLNIFKCFQILLLSRCYCF